MKNSSFKGKSLLKQLTLVLPLLGPMVAYSQSDTTNLYDLSVEQLLNRKVVSASQKTQKATDAPATIYVVNDQQIIERGYSYLDELLEDIPEIEIQRKSAPEYSNYYSVRGIAGNEKFLVLLDGVRINAPDGTPHVVGVNYPLINVKQVEVMLGPASALYGVDGFSAIINIIPKKGEDINGVTVKGKYGSFNTFDEAITMGYGKRDVSFHLTGNIYHSDEPFMPKYYKDDFSWYNNQYSQNGTVKLTPYAPVVIPTSGIAPYETPTNAYTINGGINVKDFEIGYYGNSESHSSSTSVRPEYSIYGSQEIFKINQQNIFGKHDYQSESGKFGLKSYLAFSSFEIDPNSKFQNTYSSYSDAYKYGFSRSLILREQATYQFNSKSFFIGGLQFQNTSDLAKTGDLPFKFDVNVPADLQKLYYPGTNTMDKNGKDLTIYQDFYYVQEKNIGVFGQYQTQLSKILNLTLGIRYDNNSRYGGSVNPRAGVVISPTERLKFKALYGEAYLSPSVYKAYQHYGGLLTVDDSGNPTKDPTQIAGLYGPFLHLTNTALKPEKLRSFEFGVSYIKGDIGISGDVYYNNITDLITNTVQFNQQFKGVNVSAVERPINLGTATTYGYTVKIDHHAQIGSLRLQSYASFTFSDGSSDADGSKALTYSAKNTIKAGTLLKFGKFSLDPRAIWRSSSLQSQEDASDNHLSNPSFLLVNLYGRYQITNNIEFNVKIRNLFDARYYNVAYGGPEAFAATPQDPISVLGGFLIKM